MESLKLVQECNAVRLPEQKSKNNSINNDDDLLALFPHGAVKPFIKTYALVNHFEMKTWVNNQSLFE